VVKKVSQVQNKDIAGVAIYGRGKGETTTLLGVSGATLRISIGNGKVSGEDLYDFIAAWQAGAAGILYDEALTFDGRDFLLKNNWRLIRANTSDVNAALDALPVVDGSPTTSPDDEANGSIDFAARQVRTLDAGSASLANQLLILQLLDKIERKVDDNQALIISK